MIKKISKIISETNIILEIFIREKQTNYKILSEKTHSKN